MLDIEVLSSTSRSPSAFGAIAVLLCAFAITTLILKSKSLPFPVAPDYDGDGDATKIMKAGLAKYPDEPFTLPLKMPKVVLPHSMIDEIKNLPDSQVSFWKEIYESMQGYYTGIGTEHPQVVGAVRNELTRGISKTLADLQDEVVFAFNKEIGPCEDWSEVYIYGKLLQIVALISGRVFVGLPLCRDKVWIDATINYTIDVVEAQKEVERYSSYIRPFVTLFMPRLRKLLSYRAFAARMLDSQVKDILAHRKATGEKVSALDNNHNLEKNQFNMLNWMINHLKDINDATPSTLGEEQMLVAFAAIHTTGMTASHAIFDLAAHNEYGPELRAELEEVMRSEGITDGKFEKTSITKLKKLDSFLQESQRINPLGLVTMPRIVTNKSGLTLSNGQVLPYGTHICFAHPYQASNPSPPPGPLLSKSSKPLSEFYPFRFSDMRSIPGHETQHQMVTTGHSQLSFGHGQWACPGRFFAVNEIKIVMIELLMKYDIGLGPNGEAQGGAFERPKTLSSGTNLFPDPYAKVYLKKRT